MHQLAARLGDHVGETCRAVPDFRGQHARTRLHFLNGIDVEIGKRGAAQFRIAGVGCVHGKDRGHAALAIHGELLGKIGRAVRVGHSSRRQQQEFAEIALVQRQAGNFRARQMFAAAGLRRDAFVNDRQPRLLRRRKLQRRGQIDPVLDHQRFRRPPRFSCKVHAKLVGPGGKPRKRKLTARRRRNTVVTVS